MTTPIDHSKRHITDVLFVLSLFCVFTASAMLLITLGSGIYERTVAHTAENYNARTSYAYISEKIRQNDTSAGARLLQDFGDGSALVLTEEIDGDAYETWLYLYDGNLCEFFCKKDSHLTPSAGQPIVACNGLKAQILNNRLLHLDITDADEKEISMYICVEGGVYE